MPPARPVGLRRVQRSVTWTSPSPLAIRLLRRRHSMCQCHRAELHRAPVAEVSFPHRLAPFRQSTDRFPFPRRDGRSTTIGAWRSGKRMRIGDGTWLVSAGGTRRPSSRCAESFTDEAVDSSSTVKPAAGAARDPTSSSREHGSPSSSTDAFGTTARSTPSCRRRTPSYGGESCSAIVGVMRRTKRPWSRRAGEFSASGNTTTLKLLRLLSKKNSADGS